MWGQENRPQKILRERVQRVQVVIPRSIVLMGWRSWKNGGMCKQKIENENRRQKDVRDCPDTTETGINHQHTTSSPGRNLNYQICLNPESNPEPRDVAQY